MISLLLNTMSRLTKTEAVSFLNCFNRKESLPIILRIRPIGVTMIKNTSESRSFETTVPNKWENPYQIYAAGRNSLGQIMFSNRAATANFVNMIFPKNRHPSSSINTTAIPVSFSWSLVIALGMKSERIFCINLFLSRLRITLF